MRLSSAAFILLYGVGASGNLECEFQEAPSEDDLMCSEGLSRPFLNVDTIETMHIVSFMLLRILVVLRSVYDRSPQIMWQGLLFACITRCIADGITVPTQAADFLALIMIGVREFLHSFGLRLILGRIPLGC
mmetsp:Transcript_93959/g.148494  ORF Transcript_93959/g.148494 Transcript_93959/m.148494 type:complete len:132 (-) Transcript_93959:49-444(-)